MTTATATPATSTETEIATALNIAKNARSFALVALTGTLLSWALVALLMLAALFQHLQAIQATAPVR